MILKSERERREGDDRIITNDKRQGELDELMEAPHKASHVGIQVDLILVHTANCNSKSKEK